MRWTGEEGSLAHELADFLGGGSQRVVQSSGVLAAGRGEVRSPAAAAAHAYFFPPSGEQQMNVTGPQGEGISPE
ncbi:MAG: hypothetical protein AAF170_18590 [Bacteroidota bacterium]